MYFLYSTFDVGLVFQIQLTLVVTRACKAQTVGQHEWAKHLWPIVTLKVFFFFLAP